MHACAQTIAAHNHSHMSACKHAGAAQLMLQPNRARQYRGEGSSGAGRPAPKRSPSGRKAH
jgi:hypothetical protein